jgi:hypothetical protein
VLRVSNKYFFDHLRERCLIRLNHDWPSTLDGWDRREKEATDFDGRYHPRNFYPHPLLVIRLALDLNIPSILPAAYYDLSRYSCSRIMGGVVPSVSAFERYQNPGSVKKPLTLTRLQFTQIAKGRESGQDYMANFISTSLWSRKPSPDCSYKNDLKNPSQPCQESFYFIMLNVLRSIGGIAFGRDADTLFSLIQAIEMLSRTDFSDGEKRSGLRMCIPCKLEFATCAARARQEVWESLPAWFGLDDTPNSSITR